MFGKAKGLSILALQAPTHCKVFRDVSKENISQALFSLQCSKKR
jgi:hypothetical protein